MNKTYILLLGFSSMFCTDSRKEQDNIQNVAGAHTDNHDSLTWISDFRKFRDAVYKGDKQTVKSFIDFPIMNDNNEIWYLASTNSENDDINSSTAIKPFTEKDFDKYFLTIFPNGFIKSLLKIKSDTLYKTGSAETIELNDGGNTTYQLFANFDKTDSSLHLNLATRTKYKDIEEIGEGSIIYQFKIVDNKKLRFRQVRLAG